MDSELKSQWIKALRDGSYNQGSECLVATRDDGEQEHCCLGVLADVVDFTNAGDKFLFPLEGFIPDDGDPEQHIDGGYEEHFDADGNVIEATLMIPKPHAEKWGLLTEVEADNVFKTGKENIALRDLLARMNDGGKSFEDIADFLEETEF